MRNILLLLLCGIYQLSVFSQSKLDTNTITEATKIVGLEFTSAEKDSMLDDLRGNVRNYEKMRSIPIPNSLTYPFRFTPAPAGYTVPVQQQKINWSIPTNVTLPVNKNELAYYSVTQLASLIKSKKISSVELTNFFLQRLKKWGDTLECIITLTEDRALQQAKQADE